MNNLTALKKGFTALFYLQKFYDDNVSVKLRVTKRYKQTYIKISRTSNKQRLN